MNFDPTLFIIGGIATAFLMLSMLGINFLAREKITVHHDDGESTQVRNLFTGKAYAWVLVLSALGHVGGFLLTGHSHSSGPIEIQEEFMSPPSTVDSTSRENILEERERIQKEEEERRRREKEEKENELRENSDDLFNQLWQREKEQRGDGNNDKEKQQ